MRLAQAVLCGLPLIGVWLVVTPSSQPARPRSGERSRTARSDTIPLWRFQATSDITGFILGPERAAVLYVLTKNGVMCLDAATGAQRWGRDDLPFVPPAGFALTYGAADAPPAPIRGLALGEERMAILDLVTGDKVSESSSWSVDAPRGFLPLPGPDLFLLVAKTSGNKRALLGVAPEKGDVRWRQDSAFGRDPEFSQVPTGRRRLAYEFYTTTLFGNQLPIVDTDSTAILYISKDGPTKIHLVTGAVLWRAPALRGKSVPLRVDGYASLRQVGGVVYVPVEKSLQALRVDDGRARWDPAPSFPGRVTQMELTARGLLVRGAEPDRDGWMRSNRFVALVDPSTGMPLWPHTCRRFVAGGRLVPARRWSGAPRGGDSGRRVPPACQSQLASARSQRVPSLSPLLQAARDRFLCRARQRLPEQAAETGGDRVWREVRVRRYPEPRRVRSQGVEPGQSGEGERHRSGQNLAERQAGGLRGRSRDGDGVNRKPGDHRGTIRLREAP